MAIILVLVLRDSELRTKSIYLFLSPCKQTHGLHEDKAVE